MAGNEKGIAEGGGFQHYPVNRITNADLLLSAQ